MISRRDVVTAGVLGTLSNAAMAAPEEAQSHTIAADLNRTIATDAVEAGL